MMCGLMTVPAALQPTGRNPKPDQNLGSRIPGAIGLSSTVYGTVLVGESRGDLMHGTLSAFPCSNLDAHDSHWITL